MAQWKKVIVSGSNAELAQVTASVGISVPNLLTSNDTAAKVVVIDASGNMQTRTQGEVGSEGYSAPTDGATGDYTVGDIDKIATIHIESDGRVTAFSTEEIQNATTSVKGITQLTSATGSSSEILAATAKAVKEVRDFAADQTLTNGADDLTAAEVDQLENINSVTINNTQWGYLGGMDQGVTSTSNVNFGSITASLVSASAIHTPNLNVSGNATMAGNLVFNGVSFTETAVSSHTGSHTWGNTASDYHYFTGSITASVGITAPNIVATTLYGDGSNITNLNVSNITLQNLTDGDGITDFTYDGSATAVVSVELDGATLSKGGSGLKISDSGVGTTQLNGNSVTATKIADNAVTADKLDDGIIEGQIALGSGLASTDELLISNAGTLKRMDVSVLTTYLNDNLTFTNNSDTTYDLNQSGTTLTFSSSAASEADQTIIFAGTANEIELTGTSGNIAIGLPDNVSTPGAMTVGTNLSVTGNTILTGNLTVNGTTTTLNTANMVVEDQFIQLGEGAAAESDFGIIFGGTSGNSEQALIWNGGYNTNDGRLGITHGLAVNATSATADYYLAGVFEGTDADAATQKADHKGNIRIDNDEIYICI